jgi:hypothetical protein
MPWSAFLASNHPLSINYLRAGWKCFQLFLRYVDSVEGKLVLVRTAQYDAEGFSPPNESRAKTQRNTASIVRTLGPGLLYFFAFFASLRETIRIVLPAAQVIGRS